MGCFDKGRPCFVQNAEVLWFHLQKRCQKIDDKFMADFLKQLPGDEKYYKVNTSDFKVIARFLTKEGHSFHIEKKCAQIVEFVVKKV